MGGTIMEYNVSLKWDASAGVWTATSKDVPGLVLESESFDTLVEKVQAAVPELVELNGLPESTSISYYPHSFQLASV